MCPLRGGGMRVRQTLSASAERAADRRHIHVHVYVFECMYTHTHACIHTHIHIDMHVHAIYILAGCKDCMRMPWLEGSVLEELLREPRVHHSHVLQHLKRLHPSGVLHHLHMHTKPVAWDSRASLVCGPCGL